MTGSVRSDGCDLHYEELGAGVPILLIHPAGATASTWGSVTERLTMVGRVIAYDRRGYARSNGDARCSMSRHTADAAVVLEQLGAGPAVVVGTSAGAAIAVDLAVRRPELVRAVVAHEFPWRFTRHLPGTSQVAALARIGWLSLRGRHSDAAEVLLRSAYSYGDGSSAWDAFPEEWRQAGRENAGPALADFRNSVAEYPTRGDLARLDVPVTCSFGSRSPEGMAHLVRLLAEAIPNARTHGIEGAGHAAPFDSPAEFVRLIAGAIHQNEGRRKTVFEVTARLEVREGELDGFMATAAEIMSNTREKDTKTLRYDWFISADGTECEVREAYVDADGLLEHHHHIAGAKARLFRDFADGHHMTFYCEPSAALADAIAHIPGVEITQFSFFQGLDAEVEIRDAVPA